MSYDSNIPAPQGAIKLSEVAVDRSQLEIDLLPGDSGIVALEQLRLIGVDALMRANYILHSDGQMLWDGSNLAFNADPALPTNMFFKILQTSGQAINRTFTLQMVGTTVANTTTAFKTIALSDGDLLYLEIDRETLLNTTSPTITVNNAVGGSSLTSGMTLKKISILGTPSIGIPALLSPKADTTLPNPMPTTMFIPLALCHHWTDSALTPYSDLLWIPHGIRWPALTTSTCGAVIVKGLEIYPSVFVHNLNDFQVALTDPTGVSVTGGIICIATPFTINQSITIPTGVTILGRGKYDGVGNQSTLSFITTGTLILSDHCRVKDLLITCVSNFGAVSTESAILFNGNRCIVDGCSFKFANTAGKAIGVKVAASDCKVMDSRFETVASGAYTANRYGISYASGNNNYDIDCEYT